MKSYEKRLVFLAIKAVKDITNYSLKLEEVLS